MIYGVPGHGDQIELWSGSRRCFSTRGPTCQHSLRMQGRRARPKEAPNGHP
jgi:hypothetical protein